MSEYLPEDEHADFKNWCEKCVNEGDSECHWCRDDTPDGVPSCYCSGEHLMLHEDWINDNH